MVTVHFAYETFRRLGGSPTPWTVHSLDYGKNNVITVDMAAARIARMTILTMSVVTMSSRQSVREVDELSKRQSLS